MAGEGRNHVTPAAAASGAATRRRRVCSKELGDCACSRPHAPWQIHEGVTHGRCQQRALSVGSLRLNEGCPRLQNAWAVKRVNGAAAASSSARGSAKGRRDQPGLGAPVPRWHYKGFSAVRVRFLGIRRCRARLQHEPLHQVVARSSWCRPLLLARVAGKGCWQVLLQWLLQRRLLATAVRRHCASQCVQKRAKTRFNVVRVFSL